MNPGPRIQPILVALQTTKLVWITQFIFLSGGQTLGPWERLGYLTLTQDPRKFETFYYFEQFYYSSLTWWPLLRVLCKWELIDFFQFWRIRQDHGWQIGRIFGSTQGNVQRANQPHSNAHARSKQQPQQLRRTSEINFVSLKFRQKNEEKWISVFGQENSLCINNFAAMHFFTFSFFALFHFFHSNFLRFFKFWTDFLLRFVFPSSKNIYFSFLVKIEIH